MKFRFCIWAILFATGMAFAAEEQDQTIHQFYALLIRVEPPSIQDEATFFPESSDVTALLKGRGDTSETPIWNFLRKNKNWFLPGPPATPASLKGVQISTSFRMFSSAQKRYKTRPVHVLVYLPTGKEDVGLRCILFCLGQTGGIEIGGTFFPGKGMLYELVHDKNAPVEEK